MTLKVVEKNNFDYTKGLYSDAGPLTRPDGTSLDELNFVYKRTGGRRRRLGWKSVGAGPVPISVSVNQFQYYPSNVTYWKNSGYSDVYPVVVVRIGRYLYFYYDTGYAITAINDYNRIDINLFNVEGVTPSTFSRVDFAFGSNYMFVSGENIHPFYVTCETDTIATVTTKYFITHKIPVMERDLEGVDDGFGTSTYPTINDPNHTYNLYNRGWSAANIATWFAAKSTYPAKNQIWFEGKYIDPSTGKEVWDVNELALQEFGNVSAPQGRFLQFFNKHNYVTDETKKAQILTLSYSAGYTRITHKDPVAHTAGDYVMLRNVLVSYKDSSGYIYYHTINGYYPIANYYGVGDFDILYTLPNYNSNLTFYVYGDAFVSWNLQFKYTVAGGFQGITNGFRSIAYHEGRVFYAGLTDPYRSLYSKRIYFSQSITDKSKFGMCYSDNDPTSEYQSDPLDTDGGFIYIPEIGNIMKLMPVSHNLIVFADNGIWAITPGADGYFTAISYSVQKISDIVIADPQSCIEAEGNIFFWGIDGISVIATNNVNQSPVVQSVTNGIIKEELLNKADLRGQIKGAYDSHNNILYWLYNDPTVDTTNTYRFATRILVLDLISKAFYKWSAPMYNANKNTDYGTSLGLLFSNPSKNNINATDDQVDPEKRMVLFKADYSSSTLYTYFYRMDDTKVLGTYTANKFVDEAPFDSHAVETLPYLTASYEYGQGPNKKKWGRWVECFFDRTENSITIDVYGNITLNNKSGCLMQARWDFTDSSITNKWGSQQQVYRLQRFYYPATSTAGTYDWTNGYPVVKTKNKILGDGNVLSIRFDGEAGKDCQLLGWSVDLLETDETR